MLFAYLLDDVDPMTSRMEARTKMREFLDEPFLEEQFKTWGETEAAERSQQLIAQMPGGDAEIDLRNPADIPEPVHG